MIFWKRRTILAAVLCAVASAGTASAQATLEYIEQTLDPVTQGEVIYGAAIVWNHGTEPFNVIDVTTSCACTYIDHAYPLPATVAPGEALGIPIVFDTAGLTGEQETMVLILVDPAQRAPLMMRLTGMVDTALKIRPQDGADLGGLRRGEVFNDAVVIHPYDPSVPIVITSFNSGQRNIVLEGDPTPGRDGAVRLAARATQNADAGPFESVATLTVDVEGVTETITVALSGTIEQDQIVSPRRIAASRRYRKPGDRLSKITVRSNSLDGSAITVDRVTVRGPIRVEREATRGGEILHIYAAQEAPLGHVGGAVTIHTSSRDEPEVRVPVAFITAPMVMADTDGFVLVIPEGDIGSQIVRLQNVYARNARVIGVTTQGPITCTIEKDAENDDGAAIIEVHAQAGLQLGTTEALIRVDCGPGAPLIDIPVQIETVVREEQVQL